MGSRRFSSFETFSTSEALAGGPSDAPLVFISIGENLGYAGGNNIVSSTRSTTATRRSFGFGTTT